MTDLEFDFALICQLAKLGVTQITLTNDAAEALVERMKRIYSASSDRDTWIEDSYALGQAAGIRFYKETLV